jgi:hypothetical protein
MGRAKRYGTPVAGYVVFGIGSVLAAAALAAWTYKRLRLQGARGNRRW